MGRPRLDPETQRSHLIDSMKYWAEGEKKRESRELLGLLEGCLAGALLALAVWLAVVLQSGVCK